MPVSGIHAVTIPGAVDGWAKMHERYGKLPWNSLFGPAIAYAERGFPVPEIVAQLWSDPEAVAKAQRDRNPRASFFRAIGLREQERCFATRGSPPHIDCSPKKGRRHSMKGGSRRQSSRLRDE